MSNIQVNNLPKRTSAAHKGSIISHHPQSQDPQSHRRDGSANIDGKASELVVDVMWDRCVAEIQTQIGLCDQRIVHAARQAAGLQGYRIGEIGVRITDDATIHQINAKHLAHDYPTDVISFPYAADDQGRIEGELVASVQTAATHAADVGWGTAEELLLYVIHGVLHIGGLDDHDDDDRAHMRRCEAEVLAQLGIDTDPATEACDRGE